MDDVLVGTYSKEDHLKVLQQVFARLKKHKVQLNLTK